MFQGNNAIATLQVILNGEKKQIFFFTEIKEQLCQTDVVNISNR